LTIVTSRSQLVGLVAAEGIRPLVLDLFTEQEARDLLGARLGAGRLAAEPGPAEHLIHLCARLPLALSIIAARAALTPGLKLADLAAELRETRHTLDALEAGGDSVSVRSVLSRSYEHLTPPAGRMFRLLGLHPGPDVTATAAASLAGVPRRDANRALAELTQANLITEQVPGRYACHDLLRAYATERARADDRPAERIAATHRLLDHYARSAFVATSQRFPEKDPPALGPVHPGVIPDEITGHRGALTWFGTEERVLLGAITLAFRDGFDAYAWQIPWAISPFLALRGASPDLIHVNRIALAAARRSGDRAGLAHACHQLGYAQARLGDFDAACSRLTRALGIFGELGQSINQARVLGALAMACQWRGDFKKALGHSQQALGLYRTEGHTAGQAHTLNAIGWYHSLLGDHRRALACCQRALAIHRERDDRFGQAATLDSIGHAHHQLGNPDLAIDCYLPALDLIRDFGDLYNQALVLRHLAEARQAIGDLNGARGAWQDALAILDELRHPDAEPVRASLRDSSWQTPTAR
jgi:tetratricopeptide (TPR) repeat protein